jgi:hypothetical protein
MSSVCSKNAQTKAESDSCSRAGQAACRLMKRRLGRSAGTALCRPHRWRTYPGCRGRLSLVERDEDLANEIVRRARGLAAPRSGSHHRRSISPDIHQRRSGESRQNVCTLNRNFEYLRAQWAQHQNNTKDQCQCIFTIKQRT